MHTFLTVAYTACKTKILSLLLFHLYLRNRALLWKRFPHFVQPKVLSTLCIHECFNKVRLSLQVFPHSVHVFGGASSA